MIPLLKLFCSCGGLFLRDGAGFLSGRLGRALCSAHDCDLVDLHRIERPIHRTRALVTRHAGDLLHQSYRCRRALAEDGVVSVEVWGRLFRDEELRAVGIRQARIGVSQASWAVEVEPGRDLEAKRKAALARTCASGVTALDHEVRDDTMKDSAVVERRPFHALAARRTLPFFRAFRQANKVLDADGRFLLEKLAAHLAGRRINERRWAGRYRTGGP